MAPHTGFQRFLALVIPRGLFESLEAGTRTFMFECPCGHKRDLWEAGGIKGNGNEQKSYSKCPACLEMKWHHKRKKSPEERREAVLGARRNVTLLSGHAWWASLITWGSAAMIWSIPIVVASALSGTAEIALVWLGSYAVGSGAPYLWMTTRYKVGRTHLRLYAGFMSRTLDLDKIEVISKKRQGSGLSFALDTNALWIGYPSMRGGYLVSPKEGDLFLELIDKRCAQLEMRDGDLVRIG